MTSPMRKFQQLPHWARVLIPTLLVPLIYVVYTVSLVLLDFRYALADVVDDRFHEIEVTRKIEDRNSKITMVEWRINELRAERSYAQDQSRQRIVSAQLDYYVSEKSRLEREIETIRERSR